MAPGMADTVWSGIRALAGTATGAIDDQLNEHRIRLAITGLSLAGKTVFTTALIQNLIAMGEGRDTLPRFARRLSQGGRSRLRRVRLLPTGVETIPYFDFAAKRAGLAAAQPVWPNRTEDLAQISLLLEIEHPSSFRQRFGHRRIRLDILDYPGEWLLDLPLLDRSFAAWSAETLGALSMPPRQVHAAAFLEFLRGIAPGDVAEPALIQQGHMLYRRALEACRRELGLRYLQPGRFLCPGPRGDVPFMWFFPLPAAGAASAANSVGALLRGRFETYKREVRADFFDTHFRRFNRQIVLVDVLGALYAGQAAFDDTAQAIFDLAVGLRGGTGFWRDRQGRAGPGADTYALSTLLREARDVLAWPVDLVSEALSTLVGSRGIERVAFVATKADHVPALSRDNLRNLLAALVKPAAASWQDAKATVSYHVAAAVRSTEDGTAAIGDRTVEVVNGVILGENRVRPFYVGQVPSDVPPPSFWTAPYFEMPVFRPPLIDASGAAGIPHIGLDEILENTIGDLV